MSKKLKSQAKEKHEITYSPSVSLVLTRTCRNKCSYCGFSFNDFQLAVPYHTIKAAKDAVHKGCREIYLVAGERPDKFQPVRNTLDLWGFHTYAQYVYTICELAFLEGLLPKLSVGYLTFDEMAFLREVAVCLEIMIDAPSAALMPKLHAHSPYKTTNWRFRMLAEAGRLKFPVSTGLLIGLGEKVSDRVKALEHIAELAETYGHIQEVAIRPAFQFPKMETRLKAQELSDTLKKARKILPPQVHVQVSPQTTPAYLNCLRSGVDDLGSVFVNNQHYLTGAKQKKINDIKKECLNKGFKLRPRLPLFSEMISAGLYSGKMGQILDRYRDNLKKEETAASAEEAASSS